MFAEALPEPTVRRYLDELLRLAAEHGVTGRYAGDAAAEAPLTDAPEAPGLQAAVDAFAADDLDGAVEAFHAVLADEPANEMAKAGLAQIALIRRVEGEDPAAVLSRAAAAPDDVDAQLLAADVEMGSNEVDAAFGRLLELIRRSGGEERERARQHLLDLFEVLGAADTHVVRARRALTSALF